MADEKQITAVGEALLVLAPGKINLSLLVGRRRSDGFHQVETVMAKINLYDEVFIEHSGENTIEVISKGPYWAPQGKDNVIHTACAMLLESCHRQAGVRLTLTKNMPAGSGLGSASSDAAATLIGVNKLLHLRLTRKQLSSLAARVGSDVAFFLAGPLAFCTGKGEKIKKLKKKFDFICLLLLPDVSVSTKSIYDSFRQNTAVYDRLSRQIKVLLRKNRIDLVAQMCANMLQTTTVNEYRELADLRNRIESSGLPAVCLSGSGSAMFMLTDKGNRQHIDELQSKLNKHINCKTIVVENNRW